MTTKKAREKVKVQEYDFVMNVFFMYIDLTEVEVHDLSVELYEYKKEGVTQSKESTRRQYVL